MAGRQTVTKIEKRLTIVFSRKCKNLIGLALLQLGTALLLVAVGVGALVIYRNDSDVDVPKYLFIAHCISPVIFVPVGTCAYRGGRHGLRGPLKLHMIFGTSCILFAFASVTVLSTSYASMSAWENGPTALNDNFEVLFKVIMITASLINICQVILYSASSYQAHIALELWSEIIQQRKRTINYLKKKSSVISSPTDNDDTRPSIVHQDAGTV